MGSDIDSWLALVQSGSQQRRSVADQSVREAPRVSRDIESALGQWHRMRRMEYGMEIIDEYHLCTRKACVATGAIVAIDRDLSMYGCLDSGRHHVCHLDERCEQQYIADDGTAFCMFSRHFLRTVLNNTMYGSANQYIDMFVPLQRPADALEHGPTPAPVQDRERYSMRVIRERRDMVAVGEAKSVKARAITGMCGTDSRYDAGFVDVDGTDEVDRDDPMPEPLAITAAAVESDATAPPTLMNVAQPRSTTTVRTTSDYVTDNTRRDIEEMVTALFHAEHRRALAEELTARADVRVLDALSKYQRRCVAADVRPCTFVMDAMFWDEYAQIPHLTTDESSALTPARKKVYVAFLYELWRIIVDTPYFAQHHNEFKLVNHVLGGLYMLNEPFHMLGTDGHLLVEILDRDPFLAEHLPAQNLLQRWRAPLRLRSAPRVLAASNVANGRVDFGKPQISHGRKVVKNALFSIPTDDARRTTADRIRAAYANGTHSPDAYLYLRHG